MAVQSESGNCPMSLEADLAWGQVQGRRESQQDSATVVSWTDSRCLLLLGDGMGGHVAGDVASAIVTGTFRETFITTDELEIQDRLLKSLDTANLAIYDKVKTAPELAGMGTTIIAAYVQEDALWWVSVGDSPLWLFRNGTGRRLNQNQSVAGILDQQVAAGEITAAQAAQRPGRSRLLEAVMGARIKMIDAPDISLPVRAGDVLLLASDGVETCSLAELGDIVSGHSGSAQALVQDILDAVEAHEVPYQDNATVIVLQLHDFVVMET